MSQTKRVRTNQSSVANSNYDDAQLNNIIAQLEQFWLGDKRLASVDGVRIDLRHRKLSPNTWALDHILGVDYDDTTPNVSFPWTNAARSRMKLDLRSYSNVSTLTVERGDKVSVSSVTHEAIPNSTFLDAIGAREVRIAHVVVRKQNNTTFKMTLRFSGPAGFPRGRRGRTFENLAAHLKNLTEKPQDLIEVRFLKAALPYLENARDELSALRRKHPKLIGRLTKLVDDACIAGYFYAKATVPKDVTSAIHGIDRIRTGGSRGNALSIERRRNRWEPARSIALGLIRSLLNERCATSQEAFADQIRRIWPKNADAAPLSERTLVKLIRQVEREVTPPSHAPVRGQVS